MIETAIYLALTNFTLLMLIISVCYSLFNTQNFSERLLTSVLFLCVGLGGLWGFIMHCFFTKITTSFIGWQSSPFEFEVALANLSFGVVGIIAAFSNYSFRFAVVIFTTIFLWGAAAGHIYQAIKIHNFNPGNTGAILWTDILIPLSLLITFLLNIIKNKYEQYKLL